MGSELFTSGGVPRAGCHTCPGPGSLIRILVHLGSVARTKGRAVGAAHRATGPPCTPVAGIGAGTGPSNSHGPFPATIRTEKESVLGPVTVTAGRAPKVGQQSRAREPQHVPRGPPSDPPPRTGGNSPGSGSKHPNREAKASGSVKKSGRKSELGTEAGGVTTE